MKNCSIADCGIPARAHGLCQKHYMRTRRHGDAEATRRRGRKASDSGAPIRVAQDLFIEHSPRTQARFARALQMHQKLKHHFDVDLWEQAIKVATRPNGSMNFALLERYVEDRVCQLLAERGYV